jgi:hypothetical protein
MARKRRNGRHGRLALRDAGPGVGRAEGPPESRGQLGPGRLEAPAFLVSAARRAEFPFAGPLAWLRSRSTSRRWPAFGRGVSSLAHAPRSRRSVPERRRAPTGGERGRLRQLAAYHEGIAVSEPSEPVTALRVAVHLYGCAVHAMLRRTVPRSKYAGQENARWTVET